VTQRIRPLQARPLSQEAAAPASEPPPPGPVFAPALEPPASDGEASGSRYQRLLDGARNLRVHKTLNLGERTLMILGGIVAPLGLVLVFLGWWGAAHSPYLFQQIPYLISGGLLGLGLVFLGAFFYFAHWMTELVKEHRQQSAAVVEAITRLEETIIHQSVVATNGHSNGYVVPAQAAVDEDSPVGRALVATGRGSMAHRPECVVVAGKPGLRAVSETEALEPCRLCDPYAPDE